MTWKIIALSLPSSYNCVCSGCKLSAAQALHSLPWVKDHQVMSAQAGSGKEEKVDGTVLPFLCSLA